MASVAHVAAGGADELLSGIGGTGEVAGATGSAVLAGDEHESSATTETMAAASAVSVRLLIGIRRRSRRRPDPVITSGRCAAPGWPAAPRTRSGSPSCRNPDRH